MRFLSNVHHHVFLSSPEMCVPLSQDVVVVIQFETYRHGVSIMGNCNSKTKPPQVAVRNVETPADKQVQAKSTTQPSPTTSPEATSKSPPSTSTSAPDAKEDDVIELKEQATAPVVATNKKEPIKTLLVQETLQSKTEEQKASAGKDEETKEPQEEITVVLKKSGSREGFDEVMKTISQPKVALEQLMENNRTWVQGKLNVDPMYFEKMSMGQAPTYMVGACMFNFTFLL